MPAIDGELLVKVPPGTQPNEVLRIKSKGLPIYQGTGYGDLNLRINVQIPTRLSEEEKLLYKRLKELVSAKH